MAKLKILIISLLTLFIGGCATIRGAMLPSPKLLSTLTTSGDINPNNNDRPSPLVVTMYQLNNAKVFNESDFASLYKNPQQLLGSTLIATKTLYVVPNTKYQVNWKMNKDTKYIAVMAAFNQINEAKWKDITKLKSDWGKNKYNININKTSINMIGK